MPSMLGAGLSFGNQPGTSSQFGFKQTGSSIADYSDTHMASASQPLQGFGRGPFNTQSHLVHPPVAGQGSNQGNMSYRSKDIRGAPAPVLIPHAGRVRVNGTFSNSSRVFQHQQSATRPPSGTKLSNPFRSGNTKRPPVARFPPHQGQAGKFDFSRIESDDGEDTYEMQPLATHGQPQRLVKGLGKNRCPKIAPPSPQFDLTFHPGKHAPQSNQYETSSQDYSSSPPADEPNDRSLLESPFLNLVPLDEARRQAAARRASGRDDPSTALRALGHALRHATRNASVPTNASNAGSPLSAPSAVATPATNGRVSRFVPRPIGPGMMHGGSYFSSPLATGTGKFVHLVFEKSMYVVRIPH